MHGEDDDHDWNKVVTASRDTSVPIGPFPVRNYTHSRSLSLSRSLGAEPVTFPPL